MPRSLTQKEAYNQCVHDGKYLPQAEIDFAKVESMLRIAEEGETEKAVAIFVI